MIKCSYNTEWVWVIGVPAFYWQKNIELLSHQKTSVEILDNMVQQSNKNELNWDWKHDSLSNWEGKGLKLFWKFKYVFHPPDCFYPRRQWQNMSASLIITIVTNWILLRSVFPNLDDIRFTQDIYYKLLILFQMTWIRISWGN